MLLPQMMILPDPEPRSFGISGILGFGIVVRGGPPPLELTFLEALKWGVPLLHAIQPQLHQQWLKRTASYRSSARIIQVEERADVSQMCLSCLDWKSSLAPALPSGARADGRKRKRNMHDMSIRAV